MVMKDKDKVNLHKLFDEYFSYQCSICQDTGWIIENNISRRCECYEKDFSQQRLEAAGIPSSYHHCTLENFNPQVIVDSQMNALQHSNRFVKNFTNPKLFGRGILFRGPVGVGKTHLAVAILQDLIKQGFKGLFLNFVHLIEKIKQSYDPERDIFEPQLFDTLKNCHIAVLDELGAAKPSEFVFNKLYDIINTCFDHRVSVIFTTNYSDSSNLTTGRKVQVADLDAKHQLSSGSSALSTSHYTLTERITVRLRSRILECCDDVIMGGKDYRMRSHRIIR